MQLKDMNECLFLPKTRIFYIDSKITILQRLYNNVGKRRILFLLVFL
jgi:hypothetical protein